MMDASKTGWGTLSDARPAFGSWTEPMLNWHINCLEMMAVLLAFKEFQPELRGNHVLFWSNNMTVVNYINHQWGLRSRC